MKITLDDRTVQEAARWYARMRAPDCSVEDCAAFDSWCANPLHAAAYEHALETALATQSLIATDPRLQAMLDEALLVSSAIAAVDAVEPRAARTRRWKIPVALAASLALVVASLFLVAQMHSPETALTYQTVDATRSVQLEDGSLAQLDVGTRIRVRMTPQWRQITLESGRAMFDVAHDRSRPFSVTAATSRTTALGTKFQVQLHGESVLVTLAQGSVAIDNEGSTQVWQEKLSPGEQLRIDVASANRAKHTVDPSVAMSWTRGRLLFRGARLEDAIEEVNRYSAKKVRLGDRALADLTVGGNFIAGDSEPVVAALAAVLPLRVVESGDKEIILFRRYDHAHR
jgi:transmembrane sensor